MAGARYNDWTHVHVKGDHTLAAKHLPEARKLLGFVFEEAKRNGLMTHFARRVLQDGTTIIAEKHGTIPRITIYPVGGGERFRTARVRGFVCKPTSEAFPDGFNPEHPEAAIVSAANEAWATLYFDNTDPPWEAVPAPKGVYGTVDAPVAFPDGLNQYGNMDWLGRKGERVSWLGSELRYFMYAAQPMGSKVFRAGKVLFDCTETVWSGQIRGACIRDNSLLVAISSAYELGSNGSATYWLVRVPLAAASPSAGLANLVALAGDAELLWTSTAGRNPAPFLFNQSGTVATFCIGTAANHRDRRLITLEIDRDDLTGDWSATSSTETIGGIVATSVSNAEYEVSFVTLQTIDYGGHDSTGPEVETGGGTVAKRILTGAAGTDVLIARDFEGDQPVDVTLNTTGFVTPSWQYGKNVTYDFYQVPPGPDVIQVPNAAGYGASILETRISKQCTLRMGALEVSLWDQDYRIVNGTHGGNGDDELAPSLQQHPTAEMEALALSTYLSILGQYPESPQQLNVAMLVGCDARFGVAMYYDVRYDQPAPSAILSDSIAEVFTPSPTSYPRHLTANLTLQRGPAKTVLTAIDGTTEAFDNWLVPDPDKDIFSYQPDAIDGNTSGDPGVPEFTAQTIASKRFWVGHASATNGWTEDAQYVVPNLYDWILGPEFAPAKGITDNQTNSWCSLTCLTAEELIYGGADPIDPGESVAWGNKFDPWERTAVTGAHRKVHPTWALPDIIAEFRIPQ